MPTDKELMQQALEALESEHPEIQLRAAIALRSRLAQPEQEPVATLLLQAKQNYERNFGPSAAADWIYSDLLDLLDTAPPQRKPLTDEEIEFIYADTGYNDIQMFARAIEAAHGIKGEA